MLIPEVNRHSVLRCCRVNSMQIHSSRIRLNGYIHFVEPARKGCRNPCSMGDVSVTPRIHDICVIFVRRKKEKLLAYIHGF